MDTVEQELPEYDNTAALIVTYHPDSGFPIRLERIFGQVAHVIVVDNTPEPALAASLQSPGLDKVELIVNIRNEGLGYALNQGMKRAIELGFQWVLTLDQDTEVDGDMVEKLVEIARLDGALGTLALVASNARSFQSGRLYLRSKDTNKLFHEVKTPMTSGSLHSTAVYEAIGGFRAEFFIGSIDLEYCLRARAHGFRILCSERALMTHAAGATEERHFLGRTVLIALQSPARWYLDFRNLAWTIRHYWRREPSWCTTTLWALLKRWILLAVYETERAIKAKAIASGIRDGFSLRSMQNPQSSMKASETYLKPLICPGRLFTDGPDGRA